MWIRRLGGSVVLLLLCSTHSVFGQSPLRNPTLFSAVVGLNTVPDHGDLFVSYLDYRNFRYSVVVVEVPSGIESEVAQLSYAEPEVSTFGQRVAWVGYTAMGQPDVYVHDLLANATSQITTDIAFQNHPDLSAGTLVWQDYRNASFGSINADIYMHDFATATTSQVTVDPDYQDLPRTHGDWIVWQDYRHAGDTLDAAEIYAYHIPSQQEMRLTAGPAYRTRPAIWSHAVVWEDYRNGDHGDIYFYDLQSNLEMPITTNPSHQSHPAVFGDWVLWIDYRNDIAQGDIYGYNLTTGEEYPIVVHPTHQDAPRIFDGHVVWQDYRDGLFDLWGGHLDSAPTHAEDLTGLPDRLTFESVYPNPAKRTVTVKLRAPSAGELSGAIFDVRGRKVKEIGKVYLNAGTREMSLDVGGLPPGIYLLHLRGLSETLVHPLVVGR